MNIEEQMRIRRKLALIFREDWLNFPREKRSIDSWLESLERRGFLVHTAKTPHPLFEKEQWFKATPPGYAKPSCWFWAEESLLTKILMFGELPGDPS